MAAVNNLDNINEQDLLKLYSDLMEELRNRELIRSSNNPVADYAEKVAEGSKIDTIWEATIGNMGRIIYVFEVQTKGNIDSLIVNLLQSLNNPAVQGVVAVSDKQQIETIKKRAVSVKGLSDKLKYWDYELVLKVHENLEFVNSTINELGLVPESF